MSLIPFDSRNYNFSSIYNFRDFGGYAAADGRAIKSGRLFRSAHLAALNDEDLASISELNINLVVDLRYAPERKRQPSRFPVPKPQLHEYPDAARKEKVAPHEAFLEHELHSSADAHRYMMSSYTARPHDAGFQSICRDTLRFMANSEAGEAAGVLIHCAAGKDRTGTLCALTQAILGVSREDIMADYMLTLETVDIDQIIGPAAEMFSKRYGRKIDSEALWPMFGVFPEFLDTALGGMLDGSGRIEPYAQDVLGLSQAELERLRARYIA